MYKIVVSYQVGYKYKTSSITFEMGSPKVVTLGQQYNVREKPIVLLYTEPVAPVAQLVTS